jgi:predicted solute-binding protein
VGLDPAQCRHYLHRVIQYDLGKAEIEGMGDFFQRLQQTGLLPSAPPPIAFYEGAAAVDVVRS